MIKISGILLVCLLAAGCQTVQEQAAEDDAVCRGYGLQVGSPAYVDCRKFIVNDRTARKQSSDQLRMVQSVAGALESSAKPKQSTLPPSKKCKLVDKGNGVSMMECV